MNFNDILEEYSSLLSELDVWFGRCLSKYPTEIQCVKGCNECCRSLFDITLVDAVFLKSGFDKLPDQARRVVTAKAEARLEELRRLWPELSTPYLLNHRPEEDWKELMPDDDETPCVLLGDDGRCLVYEHRPMTCRLHGLPLVDPDGEILHDEWCTMNFPEMDPLQIEDLREDFTRIFRKEVALFRELERLLLNKGIKELDTFIPLALLVDYRDFNWDGFACKSEGFSGEKSLKSPSTALCSTFITAT
jgi:Fe-S-cluster containining protein